MFDLVDIINKNKSKVEAKNDRLNSVLFYQTEECRQLVNEAYRFEGISTPTVIENADNKIKDHVADANVEICLIELNNSDDVAKDAKRISHLLPNDASVIVIGCEDAISTIRNLKAMGFYYLFWPVTKQELLDFVQNVYDNRTRNTGLGQNRQAKQISFIGSKGGVGTTLLTAEIAHLFTAEKKSASLIVDHQYSGGNLDIMMGLKQFSKRRIQAGMLASGLDVASAQSLITKVNSRLSVLALEASDLNNLELKDYTRAVVKEVAKSANFIIEDLAATPDSEKELKNLVELCDCIVVVIEPTVASLRDAARITTQLAQAQSHSMTAGELRIITVLNYRLPSRYASVSLQEVEKYTGKPVDIIIPYEEKVDLLLLEGQRISYTKTKMGCQIKALSSLLLGEEKAVKNPFALNLFKKKVNS